MALASSAGSSWANQATPPPVQGNDPVEVPFIKQNYQRFYSNTPNAIPQVGGTEFVLDQWGEEVYFPETYESKYKYTMKLTPIRGAGRTLQYSGFQVASTGFAGKPWFAAACESSSGSAKIAILDAATDFTQSAANSQNTFEALEANVKCGCTGDFVLDCEIWADNGREFDPSNWGSDLDWKAHVQDKAGSINPIDISGSGKYTWAGATALFATVTTLYAATTMTF